MRHTYDYSIFHSHTHIHTDPVLTHTHRSDCYAWPVFTSNNVHRDSIQTNKQHPSLAPNILGFQTQQDSCFHPNRGWGGRGFTQVYSLICLWMITGLQPHLVHRYLGCKASHLRLGINQWQDVIIFNFRSLEIEYPEIKLPCTIHGWMDGWMDSCRRGCQLRIRRDEVSYAPHGRFHRYFALSDKPIQRDLVVTPKKRLNKENGDMAQ